MQGILWRHTVVISEAWGAPVAQISWSLLDSLTKLWVFAKLPDEATKAMLQDLNLR